MEIDLLDSWERHLLAKNRSTATVHAYLTDARSVGDRSHELLAQRWLVPAAIAALAVLASTTAFAQSGGTPSF